MEKLENKEELKMLNVRFKGKDYKIEVEKIKFIFNKLNINFEFNSEESLKANLMKCGLLEENFLEKINQIW